jgi:hypothetical protein
LTLPPEASAGEPPPSSEADEPKPGAIALAALSDLRTFAHLSWQGLSLAANLRRLESYTAEYEDRLPPDLRGRRSTEKSLTALERFAGPQQAHGFPYLYRLCAIHLTAIVEPYVSDVLSAYLTSDAAKPFLPQLRKIKGPLAEVLHATTDDRARLLWGRLMDDTAPELKRGVGRFEAPASRVGLGGTVSESIRRACAELYECRNVLVHRNGDIDQALVEACPWLNVTLGQQLQITEPLFDRWHSAVTWYVLELNRRWRRALDPTEPDVPTPWQVDLLATIEAPRLAPAVDTSTPKATD